VKELEGITVLDLTRLLPGGVASAWMVDHGARVIKVEQPGSGDYARTMNRTVFTRTNAGKQSVAIDLKHPRGRDVFLKLAERADVLMEGFRPGVMARLKLSYEDLRSSLPRLIYISLTGYGQTGPYADLAGHDINYMALGGVLGLNLPVIPGVQIADLVGGSMQVVQGVLLALYARHTSGGGRHVDVSMTAGVTSLLTVPLASFFETGREPSTGVGRLGGSLACYNLYQAGDGRWLAVGALEPKFWAALCTRLGCTELIPLLYGDSEAQDRSKARLSEIFRTKSAEAWFEELRSDDCCVTPVRWVGEVARETVQPPLDPSPELGQHTGQVLVESGLPESSIDELRREGAIA
jgi:alpha-methylacyl-CoA racemase